MAGLLERYRLKRNFKETKEPFGASPRRASAKAKPGIFVVHKHDARRLHYDLRLEHDGVLWSWAVTRGPSLDPAEKRLAVHVEDHPFDYAGFEGTIPQGSYGAGSVIVWDRGTWKPDGDAAAGMKKGHLSFELFGEKLGGKWHLVRLKPRGNEKRDNWLLMKVEDKFAKHGKDILVTAPQSVKSGRKISDIAKGVPATKSPKAKAKADTRRTSRTSLSFIPAALATLKATPPAGDDWLHEVKFDGYRLQALVDGGAVRLLTRSGLDWTSKFGSEVGRELTALKCKNAIIDGELVVLSPHGVASFSLLQADLSEGRSDRMVFYAFDLLHLDGQSLVDFPLEKRKAKLEALLKRQPPDAAVRYSEDFSQTGEIMLTHACRMGLEGVISKRRNGPYRSGRSLDWIKSKCVQRQEFIIIGYIPSTATGRGLKSILVAYHDKGKLRYAGRVGTGFTTKTADSILKQLGSLKIKAPSVEALENLERNTIWVKPKLVAEVEFRAWTESGILRQASFQGLREDKPAAEIVKEVPVPASKPTKSTKKSATLKRTTLELSNPAKLLWPEARVSKQGLLDHYSLVWPRMEPFVVNRPLSLLRAPDGVGSQLFFQKHSSPGMPDAIKTLRDAEDNQELLYISDFDGVAALVQMGVVEIHVWGSKIDAIELPDQIVFDLDPDEGLAVDAVRAAALEVKSRLEDLQLPALVKTSGGKGFHVVVPVQPKAPWAEVKSFSQDFAKAMVQSAPDTYTATLAKKARNGRIFIDYLRNGKGSTTVAPYSARAKPEATISMPITWAALAKGVDPKAYAIGGPETQEALGKVDPWKEFYTKVKPLRS